MILAAGLPQEKRSSTMFTLTRKRRQTRDTGLFFFRGEPGGKVAVCNFVYVGAMQDSFLHALELSRQGYNAFALIYRPGAQTASEDLARAIAFLHDHAEQLDIDMIDYSLWVGSAGGRIWNRGVWRP